MKFLEFRMVKKTLFLFSLIFFPFTLLCQTDDYKFNHLDINNGLSHNQVTSIVKDTKGFMWFGTMSGLNRFDGYSFKIFRYDPQDSSSLIDNFIVSIVDDKTGVLWIKTRSGFVLFNQEDEGFSTALPSYLNKLKLSIIDITDVFSDLNKDIWLIVRNRGLIKYSFSTGLTSLYSHSPGDSLSLISSDIASLIQDKNRNLWLITHSGILQKIDKAGKITENNYQVSKLNNGKWYEYKLFADADNDIWVYSQASTGLFFLEKGKHLLHLHKNSLKAALNNDIVKGVVQDEDELIWAATDHGGINLIDKKDFSVKYILSNPFDERSLNQNSIITLYRDENGIIWTGTFKKGINYYHKDIFKFNQVKLQSLNPMDKGINDVNCFAEDENGNLWIGANEAGLVYFDRKNNTFRQYRHNPANVNSLSTDVVVDIFLDKEQKLWIGTYFGGLDMFNGRTFQHFRHNPKDSSSLSDDRVWSIFEDSDKDLWIGTLGGGLNRIDRKTNKFQRYKVGRSNSVNSDFISCIIEDNDKNIWFGTAIGVSILNKRTGKFSYLVHEKNNLKSLSNNNVITLLKDHRGWIWVGTREGLNVFSDKNSLFRIIDKKDGLTDNSVVSVLEDDKGTIWISSANGVSNLIIDEKSTPDSLIFDIVNYDEADGLQGKEFNERAALKTRKGELIFGGGNGFNIFDPEQIKINENIPEIVYTNLQIFDNQVKVNEKINGRVILQKSLNQVKEIRLKYKENMFSVEFAALDYFQPEKNKYKYKLEGFNENWLESDSRLRKATYTNLDPGDYTLHVIASNNDGKWNNESAILKISVLPPFWRSYFAYFIYALIIILLLLLLRYIILEKERMNYRTEQVRVEARQRHEIDVLKIRFITNISHEFRTPLSLILTPLEKILKNTEDITQKNHFLLIYRNARRLLNLVNQLLDFRRMEFQEFKLAPSLGDIVAFVNDVTFSFSDMAEKKDIKLSFHSHIESMTLLFDHDKIEKIIFNLLSNAFKFTPSKGNISVDLSTKMPDNSSDGDKPWIIINVKDTGIGISKEKQSKVFERFFQDDNPKAQMNQGTGIGLSLVSEFVRLHKGKIEFESEPGKGTSFTVYIPVISQEEYSLQENEIKSEVENLPELIQVPQENEPEKHDNKRPFILLVEDNDDFRFYLKDNLKLHYNIAEATNGKEGLQAAKEKMPDLIVSDIMMPEMDGIELCRSIKSEKQTSHIPVILLSAKSANKQKVEGFDTGADDYITKPFSFEILESRIKNLIHQREQVKKSFQKKFELTPSEIKITSLDEKLIQKTILLVENNISNPDFSVDKLAREVGMSRVHLYKKLSALTGKTPIEFIRVIRLRRAAKLLEKSQMTVSEIAYQVGFNNPKYFTKYFKTEFKMLPSEYIAKSKKEEEDKKFSVE